MKATTLRNRLEKLTKETHPTLGFRMLSKNSKHYQLAAEVISGAKEIRPCYTLGSGRFISNHDHTAATCALLDRIGVKYTLTNDAPRGGLTGNKITIKTKIV